MENQQALIEKRDKMKNWLQIAALGAVGLLVAPFIFAAIGGIVGLAVAAVLGITLVQLAPVFSLWIANKKYQLTDAVKVAHVKAVVNAASGNPIETLTNLLIAKRQAFDEFEQSVVKAATARSNFAQKVEKFKQRYPARAPEFEKQLSRMTDLVERKKAALADAKQSLMDGDMKLEEMKAYYEMSKDAIEANRAAGMDTGDAFEKLKADTACDAVFASMNQAFAELEVAAALDVDEDDRTAQSPAQLGHSEPVTLEVPVTATQKVSR